jgi:hypothetical protein
VAVNPIAAIGGFFGRFFGNTISEAAGFGIGGAITHTVEPVLQGVTNEAWKATTAAGVSKPPSAGEMALGVARGLVDPVQAAAWATESGFGSAEFAALVAAAEAGPGTAFAFEMWRRNVIGEPAFRDAMKRGGWQQEWIDDVVKLHDRLLTPAELAVMVQRGIVPTDGLLPVGPPTTVGKVPPMPMVAVDPIVEAAGSGYTQERLAALARIVGLPASLDLAARMTFRGIIDRIDFDRAISEGNTRNEWAPFLFEGHRQILTAHQYAELQLRGYYDRAVRLANTAKHGMSDADSDLLYDVMGRSIAVRGITTALARGGKYPGTYANVPEPYKAAIQRSNIREEYAELAYANRFTYPSLFQLNRLVAAGAITAATAADWAHKSGLAPEVVTALEAYWARVAPAKADPHVTKAENSLWTTLHKAYVDSDADDAQATATLTQLGVAAGAQPQVLALWQAERALVRKPLTASQIKKAYKEATFTQAEAIVRLEQLGMNVADATTLLGE